MAVPACFVGAAVGASVGAANVGDAAVAGATVGVGETVQATKTNESATPKTILSRVGMGCEVFVGMGGILLQKKMSGVTRRAVTCNGSTEGDLARFRFIMIRKIAGGTP